MRGDSVAATSTDTTTSIGPGIGMMTPASVHEGRAEEIYAARQVVLERAFQLHPERFSKGRPKPPKLPEPAWINPPKKETRLWGNHRPEG